MIHHITKVIEMTVLIEVNILKEVRGETGLKELKDRRNMSGQKDQRKRDQTAMA